MSDIQGLVAENRERVKTTEAAFVEEGQTGQSDLSFSRNTVEVGVTIEVYTRPLNDGLYSGHPNGSTHGSGQGVAGDVRGGWSLAVSSTNTAAWTRAGRNGVRDALNGDAGALAEAGIGSGSSDATSGDTSLDAETARNHAFGIKDATNVTRGRGIFGFADHDGTVTEFGLYDTNGNLLARATTDDVNPTNEQEVRVGVILTVTGTGTGNAVLTDDGEEAIADAIKDKSSTVGLKEFAYGSGSTEFSKSDSSLTTEEFRKDLIREKGLESLTVRRPVGPKASGSVDLSEVAVYDNQSRMVWATTFDPFTYDTDSGFSTVVTYLFS